MIAALLLRYRQLVLLLDLLTLMWALPSRDVLAEVAL